MTFDSHSVTRSRPRHRRAAAPARSGSCARYSGVCTMPKRPPASVRWKSSPSSCAHQHHLAHVDGADAPPDVEHVDFAGCASGWLAAAVAAACRRHRAPLFAHGLGQRARCRCRSASTLAVTNDRRSVRGSALAAHRTARPARRPRRAPPPWAAAPTASMPSGRRSPQEHAAVGRVPFDAAGPPSRASSAASIASRWRLVERADGRARGAPGSRPS